MTWPPDPNAPPDPDIQAFFAAIREAGDDPTPRLVFADWLEERGDPRAELVRLQVAWRTAGDDEKERDTLWKRIEKWQRTQEKTWFGKKVELSADWSDSSLLIYGDENLLLSPHPAGASVRRALAEGWYEWLELDGFGDAEFAAADELGLLSAVSRIGVLSDEYTDASLRVLGNCVELRELFLDGASEPVTDAGVAELGRLQRLRTLGLQGFTALTGTAFASFDGFDDLRLLDLSSTPLDDSVLEQLVRFTNLEELVIDYTPVRNKGLAAVGRLTRLRELHLSSCDRLTPTALSHLAGLRALRLLDLSQNVWITDGSLKHLAGFASLEVLNLHNCSAVSGAGVRHLHGLVNLRVLNLVGCSLKSHETRALKKALPNCEIIRR